MKDFKTMRKKSKLVFGVGMNDADYPVYSYDVIGAMHKQIWICPIYKTWKNMLHRVYDRTFLINNPTYIGCSVDSEWLSFSTFRKWMVKQDHEGKQLDKDILIAGNKVYSPDTCVFISKRLNTFLCERNTNRGEFPIGVCLHKQSNKFAAQCSNPFTGKRGHLGLFDNQDIAHEAWRTRKHELACRYAELQDDQRIAQSLRTRFANDRNQK